VNSMFKWIVILGLSNNRDMIGGDEKVLWVGGGWAVRGCGRWRCIRWHDACS
jgi:hypothetical protein